MSNNLESIAIAKILRLANNHLIPHPFLVVRSIAAKLGCKTNGEPIKVPGSVTEEQALFLSDIFPSG
jgi:hypothetical protein